MIDETLLGEYPSLFGKKWVNGRELDVEETIAGLVGCDPKLQSR